MNPLQESGRPSLCLGIFLEVEKRRWSNGLKGLFAEAALLVLSAAATGARIIATRAGACSGNLGLRRRNLLFTGLPAPQVG